MTGTGFVLTPDGQTWLDVALIAGVAYYDKDGLFTAFVLGPEEIRLGDWDTDTERAVEITEWLHAVCLTRLGFAPDSVPGVTLPENVGVVRAWSTG